MRNHLAPAASSLSMPRQRQRQYHKQAAQITDQVFITVKTLIKPDQTELEIATKIKKIFYSLANCRPAFPPIVAFASNSAQPHHQPTRRRLKQKNLILIDLGAKYKGYCADMTRVFFLNKPTTEQARACQIVKIAQQKAIAYIRRYLKKSAPSSPSSIPYRPKLKCCQIDAAARNYIKNQGFPNMPHGLGHSLGHRVHQPPKISPQSHTSLSPRTFFTLEPAIYLKGQFGVRIEDTFYLSNTTLEILTKSSKKPVSIN